MKHDSLKNFKIFQRTLDFSQVVYVVVAFEPMICMHALRDRKALYSLRLHFHLTHMWEEANIRNNEIKISMFSSLARKEFGSIYFIQQQQQQQKMLSKLTINSSSLNHQRMGVIGKTNASHPELEIQTDMQI